MSTQKPLDITQLTTVARQLLVTSRREAEAEKPGQRRTASAAFQAQAEIVGQLLGCTYAGPLVATRRAVEDAGPRPEVTPTSGIRSREELVAWTMRATIALVARLGKLQDGDFDGATRTSI